MSMALPSALFLTLVVYVSLVTFESTLADRKYLMVSFGKVTQPQAVQLCKNKGRGLPKVRTESELSELRRAYSLNDVWIDMELVGSTWKVSDGSTMNIGSLWYAGEPNSLSTEKCGRVAYESAKGAFRYRTSPCGKTVAYVVCGPKDEKTCSTQRYGALTMFNGETADVELPCKYRLADFTCGDYWVKVTPGSAQDQAVRHRFSPDRAWVKVVNSNTKEFVKLRTSVARLAKFSQNLTSSSWQLMNGSVDVLDFADYDQAKAAAVLRKDGVFSVEFSSAERSVVVTCSDQEFVSKGLPDALCGNETTDAMNNAITTLFPEQETMTDDALVSYIVLNSDSVTQSPTCKNMASNFRSCQDKERAATECAATIFGDPARAQCLVRWGTNLNAFYSKCMTSACAGKNFITDCYKDAWLLTGCGSNGDCPVGINAECFEAKCRCTPGYFYSKGRNLCVASCPKSDLLAEFLLYPRSYGTDFSSSGANNFERCRNSCVTNPYCIYMHFTESGCFLHNVNALEDPTSFKTGVDGSRVYHRKCM